MNPKEVKWCPQHGYPLPCAKCGMPLTQPQQKEIYEEGMWKVVDWIWGNIALDTDSNLRLEVQLKEWGLDLTK